MGAFLIEKYKCVFIHIPKTAGSTIRNGVFKDLCQGPEFESLPESWNEYYSFAFVRNPYDRMVSAWKMFSEGMLNSIWAFKDEPPLKGINFEDFLKIAIDESIDYESRTTIESVLRHHTLPQVHPFHCMHQAKFIGKFENLHDDFKIIADRIGLTDYNITHLNKTNRKSYKDYYTDKTFKIVTKHYSEDLKKFNYSFD